jgi:hypothetical protein
VMPSPANDLLPDQIFHVRVTVLSQIRHWPMWETHSLLAMIFHRHGYSRQTGQVCAMFAQNDWRTSHVHSVRYSAR